MRCQSSQLTGSEKGERRPGVGDTRGRGQDSGTVWGAERDGLVDPDKLVRGRSGGDRPVGAKVVHSVNYRGRHPG